jgi:hypothetical protein
MSDALSWADLFSNGSLIDLDVSTWDGLVRLIPADLGIEQTDAVKTAITFGHNRLVPKDSLQGIREEAGKARKLIDENAIPFKLVPGSRFLPRCTREKVKAELEKLRTAFQLATNVFIERYAENRRKHESTLYQALLEASGNENTARAALCRLQGLYPTEQELREKFLLSWKVYSIAAPVDGTSDEKQGSTIMSEIANMVDKLREQLTGKVRDILELSGRGGKITQKTYNSALNLCDRLDALNIFADEGLRAAVVAVRQAIDRAKGVEGPAAALTDGLGAVETELRKSREDAIAAAAKMMSGQAERRFGL